MGFAKVSSAVSVAALLACVVSTRSESQEGRKREPSIRVYSANGYQAINTTSYVTPIIEVGENAYVFAVAIDLDGQIQVLHPDFPGISVKLAAHRQVSLPNFFAGFSQGGSYYSSASYLGYDYSGTRLDSRGTVIALASRAPFNLEKIEAGGDWNMSAIRRLIDGRVPSLAAQTLAAYIGAPGEPIGRDFMRFAGGGGDGYYANGYNSYDPCEASYGYAFAPLRRAQLFAQINYLNRRGIGYRIAGFDLCGSPIVVPTTPNGTGRFPFAPPPRKPGDTTVFPKARFPHEGMPRHPQTTAEGVFPLPRRSGVGQMGDVTITAPTRRRGEPSEILQGYRPTPGGVSIPIGRTPIERPVMPSSEPSATGAQPVRQYRPEPRVESPPPSRAPETPRASPPPPVIHSAPPPSSPPPREAPVTRTEPARVPPPIRQ